MTFYGNNSLLSRKKTPQIGTWTPDLLGLALVSWYDANDPTTITIVTNFFGSRVSEWRDKSGNNRHVAQSNEVERPTYNYSGLNGRPAVVWPNNVNNCSLVWTGSAYSPIRSYAVARFVPNPEAPPRVGLCSHNYSVQPDIAITIVSPAPSSSPLFWDVNFGGVGFHNGSSVAEANTYNTVINPFIWTNVSGSTSRTVLWIGSDRGLSTRAWMGQISEFIQISIVPTLRERNLIEGYLAWKWGISLVAGHPFETRPPMIED